MEIVAIPLSSAQYRFDPDAERIRRLDLALRIQLRESVEYLAEKLHPYVAMPAERLARFSARLADAPVPPLTYAVYSDLVLAIDADDLDRARGLTDLLLAVPPPVGALTVRELGRGMSAEEAGRYAHYAESGSDLRLDLTAPSPSAAGRCRHEIAAALLLLDKQDPALASELRALVSEIVLCRDGPSARGIQFDGASNFMLWGAVLINPETPRSRPAMIQVLAHESAHNLLFALCPDQPLVNNDPGERYRSALRADPRPLEGIYHATFVCARMHRAMSGLVSDPTLSPSERGEAKAALKKDAESFWSGMETLVQHADYTEPGAAIIEGACAYMAAA